jgi:hypothetical protein
MRNINWRAYSKAMNTMIAKRVHITKLVHEDLPTFRRLNKFRRGGPDCMCPSCQVADETRDHIIRCLIRNGVRGETNSGKKSKSFTRRKIHRHSYNICGAKP